MLLSGLVVCFLFLPGLHHVVEAYRTDRAEAEHALFMLSSSEKL